MFGTFWSLIAFEDKLNNDVCIFRALLKPWVILESGKKEQMRWLKLSLVAKCKLFFAKNPANLVSAKRAMLVKVILHTKVLADFVFFVAASFFLYELNHYNNALRPFPIWCGVEKNWNKQGNKHYVSTFILVQMCSQRDGGGEVFHLLPNLIKFSLPYVTFDTIL